MTAQIDAIEALDRLTQAVLDNTAEDAQDKVHEDAGIVRAAMLAATGSKIDRTALMNAIREEAYDGGSGGMDGEQFESMIEDIANAVLAVPTVEVLGSEVSIYYRLTYGDGGERYDSNADRLRAKGSADHGDKLHILVTTTAVSRGGWTELPL